jgi:hypothetical protein
MASTHFHPYRGGVVLGGTDANSDPHGSVKFIFGGMSYNGLMEHGQEHGKGKITWSNGYSMEAEFDHGTIAIGTIRNPDDEVIYIGEYDLYYTFHGAGIKYLLNGGIYFGSFVKGEFHGYGAMSYSNGDVYAGSWKKGRRDGWGEYRFPSGEILSGYWIDDKNEMLSAIEEARGRGTLDELHILQDTFTPEELFLLWQGAAFLGEAEEDVDDDVIVAILDEAKAVKATNEYA